jgi:hypothetical protein
LQVSGKVFIFAAEYQPKAAKDNDEKKFTVVFWRARSV